MMQAVKENNVSQAQTIYHAVPGVDALELIKLAETAAKVQQQVVHIALDDRRADFLTKMIAFFVPDIEVIYFPAWDCLPYDRVSPSADIVAARVSALTKILAWQEDQLYKPRIVITTVNAAIQKIIPPESLRSRSFRIKRGAQIPQLKLLEFLTQNAYRRTDTVREAGELAVRGGIVDVWPAGEVHPVRVDFFGDEVDSLRYFDPLTQIRTDALAELDFTPAQEVILNEETIRRFRVRYRELFGMPFKDDVIYQGVSDGIPVTGYEHWLPLYYEELADLSTFLPESQLVLDPDVQAAMTERQTQIADFYNARKSINDSAKGKMKSAVSIYNPVPVELQFFTQNQVDEVVSKSVLFNGGANPYNTETESPIIQDFTEERLDPEKDVMIALAQRMSGWRTSGRKIMISAETDGARDRLIEMLKSAEFDPPKTAKNYKNVQSKTLITAVTLPLERGIQTDDFVVVTEQDLFGKKIAQKSERKKKGDQFLRELSSIAAGDLIVHRDHGIGRFDGLEAINALGVQHDCLRLTYAGGDKLFIPVENMEVLSKFGGEGEDHRLDKLGGAGWQARKAKVKKDLLAMADQLLAIAARRTLKKGEIFPVPDTYTQFAATFPYTETDEQLLAIEDVMGDLNKGQPMDRLVVGDVGFGKTEVAIRAAYIAAMNGVQVAVVAPTTLLARQHALNFDQRFQNTGLKIAGLSRLVKPKEAEQVKKWMKSGDVNIVIGTHALLSQSVQFANLGLIIVDEEQRFGVKQKERLKAMRADVHVLTLTATPIPRTLQMALSGVRDLSMITTPPVDRLAIRTFVMPKDPVVLREALMRERYRGGQSYYICPRISDMEELEEMLKELVPELSYITAHGQMAAEELDSKIESFITGQADILLTTNIVESGIDIPRANTMIVHRADMFGLSQLYQIRGRIGRSKVRAYAYLTTEPGKLLSDQSKKRLNVLETLNTLGAGFQLASYDLDIRGAGNLLGDQQSGHIREVGIELYQQMLEDAVAGMKQGVDLSDVDLGAGEGFTPAINLGRSVIIPEAYVSDLGVRMSLYKRLSEMEEEQEVEAFAAELIDRFGKIPKDVETLLTTIKVKQLCQRARIDKLDVSPKAIVIRFFNNTPPDPEKLIAWISEQKGLAKIRPDQTIVLKKNWSNDGALLTGMRGFVGEIS